MTHGGWKERHARESRERKLHEAQSHFTRAAAALTEAPTRENLAFAVFEGALGVMRLSEADVNNEALELVIADLRARQEGREERPNNG